MRQKQHEQRQRVKTEVAERLEGRFDLEQVDRGMERGNGTLELPPGFGEEGVLAPDEGTFLSATVWRLFPMICEFSLHPPHLSHWERHD